MAILDGRAGAKNAVPGPPGVYVPPWPWGYGDARPSTYPWDENEPWREACCCCWNRSGEYDWG